MALLERWVVNLGVPLKWGWVSGGILLSCRKGVIPFPVSRGNVAFLSRRCSGTGPHLTLSGETRGFS